MSRSREESLRLLRQVEELKPYPAVALPVETGGWEVIFPNFPGLQTYGVRREAAEKTAREMLTATIQETLLQGFDPPRPSDPERLIPDEDEPPGSELIMVQADKARLRARLGLVKPERGGALRSLGTFGR